MNKSRKEDAKILQTIFRNVYDKKPNCFICSEKSINSHLLQKNGILNLISSNNHLIQIKKKDFFADTKTENFDFKPIGIKTAMSYNLFCNSHDTNIFTPIENKELNLEVYENQLLFSYRSLCAELRKKMNNVEIFKRIINSRHFSDRKTLLQNFDSSIKFHNLGINDLNWYKNEFENEIVNKKKNKTLFSKK